jgi:hypothetical protein
LNYDLFNKKIREIIMIQTTKSKIHWNYFIALEKDLENVSRYVEFCEQNFDVYSIELAHLLFAASSEVDVIAKLLCERFQSATKRDNINDYRSILVSKLPNLPTVEVFVSRYGLSFKPWDNWSDPSNDNPLWWCSYNNVKHHRDTHFNEATLKNAINALGALLIITYYYYSYELALPNTNRLPPKDTMRELEPKSTLLTLPDDYYFGHLLI